VADFLRAGRAIVLDHRLDEIDAPSRGIALVAQQHVGRAGRGAEAARTRGAQNPVGDRDIGIGKLPLVNRSALGPVAMQPARIQQASGIEGLLHAAGKIGGAVGNGQGSMAARSASTRAIGSHGRAQPLSPSDGTWLVLVIRGNRHPDKASAPVHQPFRARKRRKNAREDQRAIRRRIDKRQMRASGFSVR
jgi:hypothetical protein